MDLIERKSLAKSIATRAPELYGGLIAHLISVEPGINAVKLSEYKSMERTVDKLNKALSESVPKRYAKWLIRRERSGSEYTICSACRSGLTLHGATLDLRSAAYCPVCGADMEGNHETN